MCFADDLFLFAKGNVDSVQITLDELTKFEAFSGMQVKKQKSAVFLAGIEDSVKTTILDMTGFSMGRLPMKYLGVYPKKKISRGATNFLQVVSL